MKVQFVSAKSVMVIGALVAFAVSTNAGATPVQYDFNHLSQSGNSTFSELEEPVFADPNDILSGSYSNEVRSGDAYGNNAYGNNAYGNNDYGSNTNNYGGWVQEMLSAVNAERAKSGAPPLCINAKLQRAAQAHSDDMARSGKMSHSGSDGSSPSDRAKRAGYPGGCGENVAAGQRSVSDVMRSWMNSAGHKRNILDSKYKFFGTGQANNPNGGYGVYWTQKFGFAANGESCASGPEPAPAPAPQPSSGPAPQPDYQSPQPQPAPAPVPYPQPTSRPQPNPRPHPRPVRPHTRPSTQPFPGPQPQPNPNPAPAPTPTRKRNRKCRPEY